MAKRPAMRFSLKDNRLCVNGETIRQLGKPPYIQFLWNGANRILYITGKLKKERDSIALERKVGMKKDGVATEYIFQRRAFADAIILRMDWDRRKSYKVYGAYVPQIEMIAFCLEQPIILNHAAGKGEACNDFMRDTLNSNIIGETRGVNNG